jgi:ATP-dependent helicase HrpB
MQFPVDKIIPALREAFTRHANAVLVAEPGAGKTTRVPLALLDEAWLRGRKIVMLEPRRLAARAAAQRMAESLNEVIGQRVGYSVRLDRKVSAVTRIEVVTEGVLTRRLQREPDLDDTGLLIFDEFHERSLDADFGLALALDVQRGLRDDLKILVMSATLDTDRLTQHLAAAPLIAARGRMFPVATRHLDRARRQTLSTDAVKAVRIALADTAGSILVFLPGEGEIRRTEALLVEQGLPAAVDVRPLYGAMALADQMLAIHPSHAGRRKIVLATTIAETSLTIDGISAVIDTGYKRVPRFDPASGMTALETVRVSQASAEQRRGRAGRTGPGICYRLWPEPETRALAPHDDPEIRVADLAPLVLDMAAWGVTQANGLPWLEEPPRGSFAQAQELLQHLEALDGSKSITAHGRAMARLPLHPRLAHMAVRAAERNAGGLAADLAAFIAERAGLDRQAGTDIAARLDAARGMTRDRMRAAARQIRSILKVGEDARDLSSGALLALAWPDRVAKRRGGHGRFLMASGAGAIMPEIDPLARQDFLAIALTDGVGADQKIHLAAALEAGEVNDLFQKAIVNWSGVFWDAKSEAVIAARRRMLGAIILDEKPLADPDPAQAIEAMTEGVRQMGLSSLPWDEASLSLRHRAAFLRRVCPEAGIADLTDEALLADLSSWLSPYLAGCTRRSHLARLETGQILRGILSHEDLRKLDRLAPARIEVPSGGHYRIDYATEGEPVLRVRLQEMFGLARTPAIADGRAQLRIELLSPAGRPLAVTQSLETFWTNGYPDVRAEMRGRYPKHKWPENPLETPPVAPRRIR